MGMHSLSEVVLLGPQDVKVYEFSIIAYMESCEDSCM